MLNSSEIEPGKINFSSIDQQLFNRTVRIATEAVVPTSQRSQFPEDSPTQDALRRRCCCCWCWGWARVVYRERPIPERAARGRRRPARGHWRTGEALLQVSGASYTLSRDVFIACFYCERSRVDLWFLFLFFKFFIDDHYFIVEGFPIVFQICRVMEPHDLRFLVALCVVSVLSSVVELYSRVICTIVLTILFVPVCYSDSVRTSIV